MYAVWRLMIDQHHQHKGYGNKAMRQVIDYVKHLPQAKELMVTYEPGEGNPSPFYRKLGFVDTGEMMGSEKIMKLAF